MSEAASSRFLWPPTIYGAAFLTGAVLAFAVPLGFLPPGGAWAFRSFGGAMIVAAVVVALAAEFAFKAAGTPVRPTEPTRAIVTGGVYAWTRNPIYLAMTAALLGAGLAANSVWFLIVAPLAAAAVTKLAIEPEEQYLSAKFGKPYLAYKSRVRRWI